MNNEPHSQSHLCAHALGRQMCYHKEKVEGLEGIQERQSYSVTRQFQQRWFELLRWMVSRLGGQSWGHPCGPLPNERSELGRPSRRK